MVSTRSGTILRLVDGGNGQEKQEEKGRKGGFLWGLRVF